MEIVVNLAKTDTIYVNFATLVENSKERVSLLKLTPPNIVRWFRTMIFCRSLSLSYSHTYTHFGLFKIWLDALCDCHCCYYDYYQNLNMMLFSLSVFCILSSVCIFFVLYYFFAAMLYTSNTHTRHFRLISNLNFAFMRCSIKFAIDIELFEQEAWEGGEILGWVQSWMHMCVAFFGLIFI